jgi:hypothetical protein
VASDGRIVSHVAYPQRSRSLAMIEAKLFDRPCYFYILGTASRCCHSGQGCRVRRACHGLQQPTRRNAHSAQRLDLPLRFHAK